MAVQIEARESLQPGVPAILFQAREANKYLPDNVYHYALSNDGRRLLIDVASEEAEPAPVTVVLNRQAELTR
jgi:hypothetical protein